MTARLGCVALAGIGAAVGTFTLLIGIDSIGTEHWDCGASNIFWGIFLLSIVTWSIVRMWKYWERTS